jgi:hypothetical protein
MNMCFGVRHHLGSHPDKEPLRRPPQSGASGFSRQQHILASSSSANRHPLDGPRRGELRHVLLEIYMYHRWRDVKEKNLSAAQIAEVEAAAEQDALELDLRALRKRPTLRRPKWPHRSR